MAYLLKVKEVNSDNLETITNHSPKTAMERRERKKVNYTAQVDKENIDGFHRKTLTYDGTQHLQNKNFAGRRGKTFLDASADRLLPGRMLTQGETVGVQNCRTHNSCLGPVEVRQPQSNKTYTVKPRFIVYKENDSSNTNLSSSSSSAMQSHPAHFSSSRQQHIENLRVSVLKKSQNGLQQAPSSSINQQQPYLTTHRNSTGGLQMPSSKSIARVTPSDLPGIPRIEQNIKEVHRKAWIQEKKPPRERYDILSLELAYNTDYMDEYMRFQIEIDAKKKHSSTFLKTRPSVNQRIVIVKYIIKTTAFYKYPSFISYQTMKIFDSFIDRCQVKVEDLQLIALASLWIALKKDLISVDIPCASKIISLAGNLFRGNKKPLIACEKEILMKLNFEISFPDPFSMFALYTVMLNEIRDLSDEKVGEMYYFGSYILDLSLLIDQMCHVSAIHLAAVAAEVALVLATRNLDALKNPPFLYWRNAIQHKNAGLQRYRLTDESMDRIRGRLLDQIIVSKNEHSDYNVVYKKYKKPRYGMISPIIVHKVTTLYLSNSHNPFYAFRRHSMV